MKLNRECGYCKTPLTTKNVTKSGKTDGTFNGIRVKNLLVICKKCNSTVILMKEKEES